LLDVFKERYLEDNSLLCDIIEALLIVDEGRREEAGRLISEVPPFEEIIAHYSGVGGGSESQEVRYQNQQGQYGEAQVYPEMIESIQYVGENQIHEQHEQHSPSQVRHETKEKIVKASGLGNSGHSPDEELQTGSQSPHREGHTVSYG
jgi:hypothetical protein